MGKHHCLEHWLPTSTFQSCTFSEHQLWPCLCCFFSQQKAFYFANSIHVMHFKKSSWTYWFFKSVQQLSWVMACFVTLWYPNEYDSDGIKIMITFCSYCLLEWDLMTGFPWANAKIWKHLQFIEQEKKTHVFLNGSGKATSIYKCGCKINKLHL